MTTEQPQQVTPAEVEWAIERLKLVPVGGEAGRILIAALAQVTAERDAQDELFQKHDELQQQLTEAQATVGVLVAALQEGHDRLDDVNAGRGAEDKCAYCQESGYDTQGLKHKDFCVLVRFRQLLADLPAATKQAVAREAVLREALVLVGGTIDSLCQYTFAETPPDVYGCLPVHEAIQQALATPDKAATELLADAESWRDLVGRVDASDAKALLSHEEMKRKLERERADMAVGAKMRDTAWLQAVLESRFSVDWAEAEQAAKALQREIGVTEEEGDAVIDGAKDYLKMHGAN